MATGSLLGKADATLVGAAEKQAQANVPSDLGEIYKGEAVTAELFQTEINTFFDELYQEHNKLSDDLNASVATVTENLSAGTMPNDEQIDLYMNHINGLRDRLKTIPKGPKGERERQKITAELNRLKNSTDQMDATLTDLTTKINNNDYIPNATGSNNMKLLTAISNGSAKQEIVNGNLVYTLPGTDLRITQADLKKMIVSNDPTVNENFNKVTSSAYDLANVDGVDWSTERQGIINNYEKAFDTREGYAQNIHQKQGNMQFTFAEILAGNGDPTMNMKIFDTLKQLGIDVPEDTSGPDGKPDGKITEADFANPENGIALIRSLTDISDPNFNFQAAKKIAAEFYTDNIAGKEFEEAGGYIGTPGMSDFDKAFAKARKEGKETFMFEGKEYGTELAEDDGSGGGGKGTDDVDKTTDGFLTTGSAIVLGGYSNAVIDKDKTQELYDAFKIASEGSGDSTFSFSDDGGNVLGTFNYSQSTNRWTDQNGKSYTTEGLRNSLGIYDTDFQNLKNFKTEAEVEQQRKDITAYNAKKQKMLNSTYYNNSTAANAIKNISGSDQYDDVYIVKEYEKTFGYFNFKAVGNRNRIKIDFDYNHYANKAFPGKENAEQRKKFIAWVKKESNDFTKKVYNKYWGQSFPMTGDEYNVKYSSAPKGESGTGHAQKGQIGYMNAVLKQMAAYENKYRALYNTDYE